MKLAIVDISNSHFSYLYSQCKIFENDIVDFYISESLNRKIETVGVKRNINFKWFILKENENKLSFYKRLFKILEVENYDCVLFNTLQGNLIENLFFFLKINKNIKINLCIHNINSFIKIPISINPRFLFIRLIRGIALRRANSLNVYGDNLKQYISNYIKDKPITTIPYLISDNNITKNSIENKIKIVIPGTFDLKRRDYETVYQVIKKLKSTDFEFVILGRQVGNSSKELFNKFKEIKNVKTYEEYIPQDEFDKQMKSADFLLGPTNKTIYNNGIKEEYGITKESGVSFNAIKYSLPVIIPEDIKKMKEIEGITIQYKDSNDLSNILLEILEKKDDFQEFEKIFRKIKDEFNANSVNKKFSKQIFSESQQK